MNTATYQALRAQARRLTRVAEEAEDLVQNTLVAALQARRSDPAWLAGTMRRQAALSVRSAVRRRRREEIVSEQDADSAEALTNRDSLQPSMLLKQLPLASRRVATLALHGLNADEIRWILGVTPPAFRQRLTSIRKALAQLPANWRVQYSALSEHPAQRSGALPFGLMRRALKSALHGRAGLGTHDADGHLIVLRTRASFHADPRAIDAHNSVPSGN